MTRRRDDGSAPLWDSIVRTPGWDVVHAYDTSVPGWLVLVLRRHAAAMAQLTDAEAAELGPLLRDVSAGLQEVTGCVKTYVAQFAEHPLHPHVHVHVIPRSADMADADLGPGVFGRLGVPDDLRVPERAMNAVAAALRATLSANA